MAITKDDASSYAEMVRASFDDYTIDRIRKQNEMLRGMMDDAAVQKRPSIKADKQAVEHDDALDAQRYQAEFIRRMEDQIIQGSSIKAAQYNPLTASGVLTGAPVSNSVFTSGPLTSNAGQSWYGNRDLNEQVMANCKGKMVVDIGVIANGACITFDDFSMLEIVSVSSDIDLKETSHLNLLNGLQLDDIVTSVHQSLFTKWVGNLSIYAVNGWKLDFKIMSGVPVGPFNLELKVNNAVR
jgi:hypothetical protein